jgi:hypothetical protein
MLCFIYLSLHAVSQKLLFCIQLNSKHFAWTYFSLDQEVEVLVIDERLLSVALTEEPRIISKVETCAWIVDIGIVLFNPWGKLVWKLILALHKIEMKLGQRQSKSGQFQIVLEK